MKSDVLYCPALYESGSLQFLSPSQLIHQPNPFPEAPGVDYLIWVDGCYRQVGKPNPVARGGWGGLVRSGVGDWHVACGPYVPRNRAYDVTSFAMEILAVTLMAEAMPDGVTVRIYTDAESLVSHMAGKTKTNRHLDLYGRLADRRKRLRLQVHQVDKKKSCQEHVWADHLAFLGATNPHPGLLQQEDAYA